MKILRQRALSCLTCTAFACFLSLFIVSDAHSAIIAEDTFTLNGTTRVALDSLNGVAVEDGVGGLSWVSSPNFIFRQDARKTAEDPNTLEGIASTSGSSTVGFGLDFNFATYTAHGTVATVKFSAFYRKTGSGFLQFGFTNGSKVSVGSSNGILYVKSDPKDKTWSLVSMGNTLASGTIPGTVSSDSAWLDYSLSFDNATKTIVDLSINGTSVVSNLLLTGEGANMTVSALAIMAQLPYSTVSGNGFDDFKLEVTSAIPEPATGGMLMGVGAFIVGAGVIARKKLSRCAQ